VSLMLGPGLGGARNREWGHCRSVSYPCANDRGGGKDVVKCPGPRGRAKSAVPQILPREGKKE